MIHRVNPSNDHCVARPDREIVQCGDRDLGGIGAARSLEMYAPLYFTLVGALGTYDLNIAVVRAS
jgi:hypothetical protein